MIVPSSNESVTPAGDWAPNKGLKSLTARLVHPPLCLELRDVTGLVAEVFDVGQLGRRFGRHDPELRGLSSRWIDSVGQSVVDYMDLGDVALVNTLTGVAVPLADVPRLLGCDVGTAGAAALVGDAQPAVMPMAAAPALPPAEGVYTTNKIGPHIPGKTRAWTLANVKTMPGARKIGRDWIVSHGDFQAWCTAQDTARCRASAPEHRDVVDARTIAESTLAKAGLRPTKGGE